jgi:protein-S-isoprenylcysteine O-methyltransferase Ste14
MTDTVADAHAGQLERPKPQKADTSHFGGPLGAKLFLVLLPSLTIYLWICIHKHAGDLVLPTLSVLREVPLPTVRGAAFYFGWIAFQAALEVLLPGKTVMSPAQRDGLKVPYKLNGFSSLWVSLAALVGAWALGWLRGASVLAELGPMLTTANLFAYGLSGFLYVIGLSSTRVESRSGQLVYDYFMGSSLNPRLGGFDLKLFFESKIGMTTWIAITLLMAAAQYEARGSLSLPMLLVCAFQLFYVADFYYFEDAMLTTWDINHENYGYMLAFGFVVWMPFTFSLQAQYLVTADPQIPIWAVPLVVALNFAGYFIFRTSNLQKHHFRTNPDTLIWGKKPSFIATKRGTKLLTSGWWGLARHANYLGDLMMALAWCLPTGVSHVPPYFYFIYFAPLLIDRERRDHKECKKKYGDDWDTYCEKVKYRIVPYLY